MDKLNRQETPAGNSGLAKVAVSFSADKFVVDKKRNVINFLPALKKYATCKKYLDITLFKKFKVDSGNIVWGNNRLNILL